MTEPSDLRDLLGDNVPAAELERLSRAHEALDSTPAPPDVPESLTVAVLAMPAKARTSLRRRRSTLTGLALAACIAGAAFGIGFWTGDREPALPATEQITLNATEAAPPNAKMVVEVLPIDAAGNWPMVAEVRGLPKLAPGGYYEVWLTRGDKLAESCGRFVVGPDGTASDIWLNAPYKLTGFDRWVVTATTPGQPPSERLLDGPVVVPA
jgi:hypothetical protein